MIPDKDVVSVIVDELPELKSLIIQTAGKVPIYQNVKLLADITCKFIDQHNFLRVGRCFRIAERLFQEGSQTTKNAIDNIFVFSVTSKPNGMMGLEAMMPLHLRQEYHRQIYSSGI
jgi:hypothetical protein